MLVVTVMPISIPMSVYPCVLDLNKKNKKVENKFERKVEAFVKVNNHIRYGKKKLEPIA